MLTPFHNEPLASFTDDAARAPMQDAIARVERDLGREYPIVIGGQHIQEGHKVPSRNPARLSQTVGFVFDATAEMAEQAVQAARSAYPAWSNTPAATRARYLTKAAAMLRRRIHEFAAWMVFEASKSWAEAYNDAAEAIDFLEFYAREAVRWSEPQQTTPFTGEENEVIHVPIGVGAVITPWNFPLAILAGMTAAPIAAGNTVVVKPAEQTPIIAAKFMHLLEMADLPPGVVNLAPGPGEVVGEALTGNPDVQFITFTGSKEVGLHIAQRAAELQPGQRWLKRAVLEMGGKDAIIVDSDVNLDGAAEGVVASAFGFQGQKCSACSRLIAHSRIYDRLLDKIVERASRLTVGDPTNPATFMGAVIDSDAYRKIMYYIAIGRGEGRVLLGGEDSGETNDGGYFIHPTVIADVDRSARVAQEEIFGPVLSVIKAESFDEALDIANDTDYGLTGGVYSYDRNHLEQARREFHVGNLYLNRKITGALVDVQPFGGFKLSGTDSKAGGRDYMGHFLLAKSICERW